MKEIEVYNTDGKKVDIIKLDEKKFNQEINQNVLHQAITMYLSNMRMGTSSTKNRKDVRGGGRKPWRQKGTGQARAGSRRSPIFRGGGVVFGPKPRDYSYSIPKKIRKKALLVSIKSKIKDNALLVIDKLEINRPKTKDFLNIFKVFKLNGDSKLLIIVDELNDNIKRSSRNIKNILVKSVDNFTAYDVLTYDKLVMTKKSFDKIDKRVQL